MILHISASHKSEKHVEIIKCLKLLVKIKTHNKVTGGNKNHLDWTRVNFFYRVKYQAFSQLLNSVESFIVLSSSFNKILFRRNLLEKSSQLIFKKTKPDFLCDIISAIHHKSLENIQRLVKLVKWRVKDFRLIWKNVFKNIYTFIKISCFLPQFLFKYLLSKSWNIFNSC